MKVIDPAVRRLLVHSISNPPLGWSDCHIDVLQVCPSGTHGRRTGLRTAMLDLLVVEDSCGRTVLSRALTVGCSSRSKAARAVAVAAIVGLMEGVVVMQDVVEVCSSRSVP
jgi:hypothetical protein